MPKKANSNIRMRMKGSNSDISSSSSTSTSSDHHSLSISPISPDPTPRGFSSRLRRIFKGPPKPKEVHTTSKTNAQPSEPYTHVPIAASSAFLKTTTRTDMFEVTQGTKLNTSRSMNDLLGNRPMLASRASESRLKHIEAAERDLTRG